MKPSALSLKWLELFQLVARTGSVQAAADEAGLSVSTVSHHLGRLETVLGTPLIDHTRRPMRITPTGAVFLNSVDEALRLIRKAEIGARAGSLPETRNLSLALIEDFDSEIGPELARSLAASMPRCAFRHMTRPSHEILALLRAGEADMGVATRPPFDQADLVEYPLLRDPFVLAVPARIDIAPEDFIGDRSGLPLLRYSQSQIIGPMIEAHLRRLQVALPNRFEIESNQSILGLVAEGSGWAITTPMNYLRASRFQRQVRLLPFPGKGFARTLSLFATDPHRGALAETLAETLRQLIRTRAVDPAAERLDWLRRMFTILPQAG